MFLADELLVPGGKLTRILQKLTRSEAKPDPPRANSVWQNIYTYDFDGLSIGMDQQFLDFMSGGWVVCCGGVVGGVWAAALQWWCGWRGWSRPGGQPSPRVPIQAPGLDPRPRVGPGFRESLGPGAGHGLGAGSKCNVKHYFL